MEEKKYKLTDESIEHNGRTLYRIQALKAFLDVEIGDLGGFVESEDNLSHDGDCWIYNNAKVYDTARVQHDVQIHHDAEIYGEANIFHNAIISDFAKVYDHADVSGFANVGGDAQIYGNAWVCGGTFIRGNTKVLGSALVDGSSFVDDYCILEDGTFSDVNFAGHVHVNSNGDFFGTTMRGEIFIKNIGLRGNIVIKGDYEFTKPEDIMILQDSTKSFDMAYTSIDGQWHTSRRKYNRYEVFSYVDKHLHRYIKAIENYGMMDVIKNLRYHLKILVGI